MQVVLQEVGAGMAPVAVVDREVRAFGPLLALLLGWLRHVQDDRDAVLVVVSLDALVRVCCITYYVAVASCGKLSPFEIS